MSDALDAAREAITEHERELWNELNQLLRAAVPPGASIKEAELAMFAATLSDPTIRRLLDRVRAMTFSGRGFLREQLEDPAGPRSTLFSEIDELDDGPLETGIEDAISGLLESLGEELEITTVNTAGEVTASAAGLLVRLEGVEEGGELFAEFRFSPDDGSATIRISRDPETRCLIAPDGSVTGVLPSGDGWSIVHRDGDSPEGG